MRGRIPHQPSMFALVSPDEFVPKDHPIRRVKALADEVLRSLDQQLTAMYAERGRDSVAPERLLKASLLQALFSVRSERQLCEQLGYNLLFRWFLDMDITEPAFDATSFCKNRERLMEHEVAAAFFRGVLGQARGKRPLSQEHFSVDGTLIEAWASLKSVRPRDERPEDREPPDDPGNASVNFRGEKRSNDTHASTTDPEARLARKGPGKETRLCYGGHALMDHEYGLLMDVHSTARCRASGASRSRATKAMTRAALCPAAASATSHRLSPRRCGARAVRPSMGARRSTRATAPASESASNASTSLAPRSSCSRSGSAMRVAETSAISSLAAIWTAGGSGRGGSRFQFLRAASLEELPGAVIEGDLARRVFSG